MKRIELKHLRPMTFERSKRSEERLEELAESIGKVGVVQPILVRPARDGYELVFGSRRVEAAKRTSMDKLPALIRHIPDHEALELMLVENVHRKDLSAVNKDQVCRLLMERFPERYPNQAALAKKVDVKRTAISSWVKISCMPDEARRIIAPETKKGKVPKGKIDYFTAVRVAEKVREPGRLVSILRYAAKRRIKRKKLSYCGTGGP